MPELPDLEIIKEVLSRHLPGQRILQAEVVRPIVVRLLEPNTTPQAFLEGRTFQSVERRGKFLILALDEGRWIALNAMLAGQLHYRPQAARGRVRDYFVLRLSDGAELRYHDLKGMGKVYLARDLAAVPGLAEMGPDALDSSLDLAAFLQRLCPHHGEIKGLLTRGAVVAGIGNAYADEILFRASIYPFRPRTSLTSAELTALYTAMRDVLQEAIGVLRERVGEEIHVEVRDFLQVHNRPGQPCPRCGHPISEVKLAQRATHFCRHCQPGTLVRNR